MFRGGDQLSAVVDRLANRGVSLWHACQLVDFDSYLAVGGIPSRSLLEQAGLPFTGFDTDGSDRRGGHWPLVFVNLNDFGAAFAHGADAIPNPYGPIVFQIRPTALLRSLEVAVCLRSAGARDFDRATESLGSDADLELLFRFPAHVGFPYSSYPLYGDQLRSAFAPRHPWASSPEVSLQMDPELIPLEDVIAICVDPIERDGLDLVGTVREMIPPFIPESRVRARYLSESRRLVLSDLARYVGDAIGPPSLQTLGRRADVAPDTRDWARSVLDRGLDWQFKRYVKYLLGGTLRTSHGGAERREERTVRGAARPAPSL